MLTLQEIGNIFQLVLSKRQKQMTRSVDLNAQNRKGKQINWDPVLAHDYKYFFEAKQSENRRI